ncbi:MAG: Glu/Leu/Phe/Val family dehydrogenase [Kribbellaceae bacterium]
MTEATRHDGWPIWQADELGPRSVTFLELPGGLRGVVAVDNITLGSAIGGLRMTPDVTPAEVLRLARAMTLKNAAVGLPHGGAKSGIAAPYDLDPHRREAAIRAFAARIAHLTEYWPGPDMGTDETAMAWVYDEIGRSVGRPAALGGIPLDTLGATAHGLAVCAEVLQDAGLLRIPGARVAVQGFGAVGRNVALMLHERGAQVVAASDRDGAVMNPDGLDVPKLAEFVREHTLRDFPGGVALPRDELITLDCDVLIPAAQPDAIDEVTAGAVRARIVLEGANIPATAAGERRLHDRKVLVVPDIIANAGGVICAAAESRGLGPAQAFADIAERMRSTMGGWLEGLGTGLRPRQAALDLATERLRVAAAYRRSF